MRVLIKGDNLITKALTKGVSVGAKEHITKKPLCEGATILQKFFGYFSNPIMDNVQKSLCFGIAYMHYSKHKSKCG